MQSASVFVSSSPPPNDELFSKMASQSWLTQRFQGLVDALMPKVTAALQDKQESHRLDLATAENHLIRKELIGIYKTTLADGLESEVSWRREAEHSMPVALAIN